MEKVLKAEWIPKKENREKVYENVIFETPVRGLDISYKTGSGSFEVDVCINGKIIAVAALTSTAGYRDLETVHVDIPEIVPGTIRSRSGQRQVRIFMSLFLRKQVIRKAWHI